MGLTMQEVVSFEEIKYLYPEEYNNQRTGFISSVYFVSKVKRGSRIV